MAESTKKLVSEFQKINNKLMEYSPSSKITSLKGDTVLWILTILMMAFSLITVYSFVPILVKVEGGSAFGYLSKHFIYIILSIVLMFVVSRSNPKYFSQLSKLALYIGIGLLLLTMILPTEVNSAKRWIRVPFIGLTFQAADFAKIALILYLSKQLAKRKDKFKDWREGFVPIVIPIFLIVALIVKDNFSTAAIVFALATALIVMGKFPFSRILVMFGFIAGFGLLAVGVHKALPELNLLPRLTTWENRIINRIDTEANVVENAQAINAQLAIYNGKFFGQGLGEGKLKEFLPEAYADFFFSSFVEEFGFMSAVILVFLYLIMLFRILKIGVQSNSLFETYFSFGIGMLILTQASVNMMVCTGITPVTGQNMPFLAMGGSAMMMTSLSVGMIQSIAAHNKLEKNKNTTSSEDEIE